MADNKKLKAHVSYNNTQIFDMEGFYKIKNYGTVSKPENILFIKEKNENKIFLKTRFVSKEVRTWAF